MVPVLRRLRREGTRIEGPFPADAFFSRYRRGMADAVIAAYHDQGLIPLKLLARNRGVNVTVGLPIIRTSPDHGTGFDIAGKHLADPASMIEAILLASRLYRNRQHIRTRGER